MKLSRAIGRRLTWVPIAMMSAGLGGLAVASAFASTSEYDGVRSIEYGSVIASAVLATFAVVVWPSFADRIRSRIRVVAQLVPAAFFIIVAVVSATISFQPSDPNDASEVSRLFPFAILLFLFLLVYVAAVVAREKALRLPSQDLVSE